MTEPQEQIQARFSFMSTDDIGAHVTQVAIDGRGEFAVLSNSTPERVSAHLRAIANYIDRNDWTGL